MMIARRFLICFLIAAFGMFQSQESQAQSQGKSIAASPSPSAAHTLNVTAGSGAVVAVPSDISRIALADESVAKVTVLSNRELLIHGEQIGRTTLFIWLLDESMLNYVLNVRRDLELLTSALGDLDPRIGILESSDGKSLLLQGTVDDARSAREALARAEGILKGTDQNPPTLLNLLRYPQSTEPLTADARLEEALREIDPRISVRRIQVGEESETAKDSYVLEGRVKSINDLLRAVTLAERQLGGAGGKVKAPDDSRVTHRRSRSFLGGLGGASGSGGRLQALEGVEPPPAGLASQVSRGLIVASESGRVISFLDVDELYQVLVSIRVLEIDRNRARQLGVNYRVDGTRWSLANFTSPNLQRFGDIRGTPASVSGVDVGNYVGAYVSSSIAILGAIDALESKAIARSVAEPNVLTLTGEEATVVVGGEVPIPTTAVGQVAAVQGFAFQTFGVRLDIRPTVDDDRVITMEVAPSIVRPDQSLSIDDVPGFQVQSVQTTARVRAGESLILGGLLSYDEGLEERKVPVLGDIPLIKAAFKWQRRTREERELLFVITPNLITNVEDVVKADIDLPALDSREYRIGYSPEIQNVDADGMPSSWVEAQRKEMLDAYVSLADKKPEGEDVEIVSIERIDEADITSATRPEASAEDLPDQETGMSAWSVEGEALPAVVVEPVTEIRGPQNAPSAPPTETVLPDVRLDELLEEPVDAEDLDSPVPWSYHPPGIHPAQGDLQAPGPYFVGCSTEGVASRYGAGAYAPEA